MTLNELFEQRRDHIQRRLDARLVDAANGCRLFSGTKDRGQYGQFYINGTKVAAHRVAYALAHGPIPPGALVCHRCDNPTCANVDHLFLGTVADNNADCSAKGRSHQPFGAVEKYRKLTEEDVVVIRNDRRSAYAIARELGVHRNTVAKVRRGESWKHVRSSNVEAA